MAFHSENPVSFESVSNVTSTNSVDLGTRATYAGRQYCYVYNAGNSQISVGQGAIMTASSGYSVTVSSVTGLDIFVGVCHHATIATAQYGWLVTHGHTKIKTPAGSICTNGDLLFAGGDGVFSPNPLTGTASAGIYIMGKCVAATASAGIGEGFVNCLF